MLNLIVKNKMIESHKKRTIQEREYTRNKTKLTSLKKYGTNHSSQSKEIKEKSIIKFKTRYYEILNKNLNEIVLHGLTLEQYLNGTLKDKIDFQCKKCGTQFNDYINYNRLPKCPICFPHSYSKSEKEIFDYIKIDLGVNAIQQDKKVLDGKEIDILITEKNLGIEYHGLMYHSFGKDIHSPFNNWEFESFKKNRHIEKFKKSNDKNINLLQIFENEWLKDVKKEIWKSIINNKLGKIENKIFARKCIVKEVGSSEKNEFLENNHLQGKDNSRVKLGLYYEEELVQIMTFGASRYSKNINWEMHRFATKKNMIIVGGASKLFKHFENNYLQEGEKIVTYADLRYATGKVYQTLGFEYSHSSSPNFFYFKKGSYILESRISFQKHKLKDKLKKYDENLSANENMFNNGYRRIWDCGNKVYVYKKRI